MSLLVHSAAALGLVSGAITPVLASFFTAASAAGQGGKILSKGLVF